jgi:hypothetical protein
MYIKNIPCIAYIPLVLGHLGSSHIIAIINRKPAHYFWECKGTVLMIMQGWQVKTRIGLGKQESMVTLWSPYLLRRARICNMVLSIKRMGSNYILVLISKIFNIIFVYASYHCLASYWTIGALDNRKEI